MVDDGSKLDGTVEMDETWIGGYVRGHGSGYKGNKKMILGAIQRGGDVKLRAIVSPDGAAIGDFVRDRFAPDTDKVYTDSFRAYQTVKEIRDHDTTHQIVKHSDFEWVRGDVHTNSVESVWSLLKRAVVGSYHQISTSISPRIWTNFHSDSTTERTRTSFGTRSPGFARPKSWDTTSSSPS